MESPRLVLEHIGPIKRAELEFGDLTVLVGPQASGKSILLQMLNFVVDSDAVVAVLKDYGTGSPERVSEPDRIAEFFEVYFGEGMSQAWSNRRSVVHFDGKRVNLAKLIGRQRPEAISKAFYIPACRALTFQDGWPRPWRGYRSRDPFVVRYFSERMNGLMDAGFQHLDAMFPKARPFDTEPQRLLREAVFRGFGLTIDRGFQKRLVLRSASGKRSLSFMAWSSGQREAVPLLLSLDWLLPAGKTLRREAISWVFIEEPEMGLHPQAISAVMFGVLELLRRGYRVCLSTHSPRVLDVVWALKMLHENGAKAQHILRLFNVEPSPAMTETVAARLLEKKMRVYYLDAKSGRTTDISELDPGASDSVESGWGGLVEPSDRPSVSDIVSEVVTNFER